MCQMSYINIIVQKCIEDIVKLKPEAKTISKLTRNANEVIVFISSRFSFFLSVVCMLLGHLLIYLKARDEVMKNI